MSEQENKNMPVENEKQAPKKAEKKPEKKPGLFAKMGKWFRDFKSECKKVVWPTGKQVVNNTVVVIVAAVIVCVFVYILDGSFGFVRDTLAQLVS